ncbi:uncharacterized protein Dwil_GK17427 [Drosophila willistoni]|uniref:Syntaxin N-terminal domain-containing protein n=1 Tax=Drosophila willistoni TaxID=7260 RepID=B4MLZ2_DROWI|nr:uncharacterized protein LOC6638579 [Drosophila willistoni]EDW73203.1 uncharacterized protein Dwil_GK17427 [Drosophila willistoni]
MDPRLTLNPNNRITSIEMHSRGTTNWNTDYASFYKDIEVNIALIQNSCDHLDKQLKLIGTPKDLAELRDRILIIYQKTNNRIRNTGENIEGLHTVFSTGDLQQKINVDKIKRNYFNVIKHYVSVQKRIVLAARQSDKLFWDTNKESNQQDGKETIARESFDSMSDQWQQKGDCLLLKRQEILRLMELEILDINEIIINLVSGLVNDHSWQLGK